MISWPTIVGVLAVASVAACGGRSSPRPDGSTGTNAALLGVFGPDSDDFVLFLDPTAQGSTLEFQLGPARSAFTAMFPVAGDFFGTKQVTVGFYDPATATFHLGNENGPGDAALTVQFGTPGAKLLPVAGDFDGDGVDTIGLYDVSTNLFQLRNTNASGPPDLSFTFGTSTNLAPVVGDFDGDGIDTVGLYDTVEHVFYLKNSNTGGDADIMFPFAPAGTTAVLPVAGDFGGMGIDSVGVFDLIQQTFYLKNTNTAGSADATIALTPVSRSLLPIAGNWTVPATPSPALGYDWPTTTPSDAGFDPALLQETIDAARDQLPDLQSLLIVRNGKLVTENYFHGGSRNLEADLRSVSKSIQSALVGIGVAQGTVMTTTTIGAALPASLTAGADSNVLAIPLSDLLEMRAGIAWDEYGSDAADMLMSSNWVEYVLARPMAASAGSVFDYDSGIVEVSMTMLTNAVGRSLIDFANQNLFGALGIQSVRWDLDPQGNEMGGAGLFLTSRDMARFGFLYLNAGSIGGQTVVDPSWVAASTSSITSATEITGEDGSGYGAWWWTNTFAGHSCFFAWGTAGQFIFVIPDLAMVVVMTSNPEVSTSQASSNETNEMTVLSNGILASLAQ